MSDVLSGGKPALSLSEVGGNLNRYCRRFEEVGANDVALVGGKNASLGELTNALSGSGIRVPQGFASTSAAYWAFLDGARLRGPIAATLAALQRGEQTLESAGASIRSMLLAAEVPDDVAGALHGAYTHLSGVIAQVDPDVAVRSSATAEDLPTASFAGQQRSFLHVHGFAQVLDAWKQCVASLFTDRAISYRDTHGFGHLDVALSVGVQRMVRADLGASGVAFTLDTETGFPHVVVIDGAWGLGEALVGGAVEPDEFVVFKPALAGPLGRGRVPILSRTRGRKAVKVMFSAEGGTRTVATEESEREGWALDDGDILRIARWAVDIEQHFGCPMDIEWARDGVTGELFVVQARPETVAARRDTARLRTYRLVQHGPAVLTGISVGQSAATGPVCVVHDAAEMSKVVSGCVLVTRVTDPDWVPVMKKAAALVTDHGGRTSHAAIVSRELDLPAVVGTGCATTTLRDGQIVTVSAIDTDEGVVYDGAADIQHEDVDLAGMKPTRTRVMLNIASPAAAMRWWRLPAAGIGLLRMEFLVSTSIKAHPMALAHPEQVPDDVERAQIEELTRGCPTPADFFVDQLAGGVGRIAASRWPDPVVVRMSDFKTNEYAHLLGGSSFEPAEKNPMIGWRGASRYYDPGYRDGFALECRAMRRVRSDFGLTNVQLMIPFCRTLDEADRVLETMAANGLASGDDGLKVYVMAEIPANIVLAEEFASRFDGFSIGSNDLTQLVLGVDRDSERLAELFDETNPAVTRLIAQLIETAHRSGRHVGFCGQRPSSDPAFARFLVEQGIDSISVTPDSFFRVREVVAEQEALAAARGPARG